MVEDQEEQEGNFILKRHPDLIGMIDGDGHAVCLPHARQQLGGAWLNALRRYDQDGSGPFIVSNMARDRLLVRHYYCSVCPEGTLLPTLKVPCTVCSTCGHSTQVVHAREVASVQFGVLIVWLCSACAALYPEQRERRRILARVRREARKYDLFIVKQQPGIYMLTCREQGVATQCSYMPVMEDLTFLDLQNLEKIKEMIQDFFRPEYRPMW